jgi:hypothetical protein
MQLRYYDHTLGRERIKRRYKYAAWAFTGGTLLGYIVGHLF